MDKTGSGWGREARALSGVAWAVGVTMFAQLAIDAVETAMVARLGAMALAGVTLAIAFHAMVFLFALGVVTAVTPLAAHEAGRGDAAALRRIGQNGVWVALGVSLPLAAAMLAVCAVLPVSGPVAAGAVRYLAGAACGLPGWVVYVAIRCFAIATGRVRVATAIMLAAVPAHAGLAWALVFGAGWGVAGAGIAYALTAYAALGLLAAILAVSPQGAFGTAFRRPFAVDPRCCAAILRLGLPFAVRIVLREGVLPVAALGLAPFGADAVAAHAVASRVVMLAGVFSFGFSDAANMRVGRAIGAGAADATRRAGWVAVQLAAVVSLVLALAVALAPHRLAAWVLGPGDPAVLREATALLPVAAILLFLEGVQSAGSGALSGMRDARGTLVIAVLGGWVLGLPLGLFLAATSPAPAIGLWTGLCLGWTLVTALTLARFHRLARRSAGQAWPSRMETSTSPPNGMDR